jgi:hypothetical protein
MDRWNHENRSEEKSVEAGGITEWELKLLRAKLLGRESSNSLPEVEEILYPKPGDPDYDSWLANMETEFERTVTVVHPDFLNELCSIHPSEIDNIGQWWGSTVGHDWHKQYPDHATSVLRKLIETAEQARASGKCVFNSTWF